MSALTSVQVCRIARVTYRQLDYWDRTGVVRPSIMDANGSGTQRLYREREARVAFVLGRLAKVSIPVNSDLAREVAEHVHEFGIRGQVHNRTGLVVVDLDVLDDPFLARVA